MKIDIDKNIRLPIYIQIKNSIHKNIKLGNLRTGDKLPPERELAKKLNVSRNTISNAYKILEEEGAVVSFQGRGTFISEESGIWKKHAVQDKIIRIIDLAVDEGLTAGLLEEEMLDIFKERFYHKKENLKNLKIVFVECNIELSQKFGKQLKQLLEIDVESILISDIESQSEKSKEILEESDYAIVTYNHINHLKELLKEYEIQIIGAAINPKIDAIVNIAKYPNNTKFGLVSLSKEFLYKVEYAMEISGMKNLNIIYTTSKNVEEIKKIVEKVEVVIISPGLDDQIKKYLLENKDTIKLEYVLDRESIKIIKNRITNGY
jgi:DNA-binding transcriptional regulator YhcF (GntR family)